MSTAAKKYVPKRSLKAPHLDELTEVPRDLHKRLELVGKVVLMEYLEDPELTVANFEHTTTDIAAALCGTGVVVEAKGKKTVSEGPRRRGREQGDAGGERAGLGWKNIPGNEKPGSFSIFTVQDLS